MYFVPPPPTDDRDIALGQFMHLWSKLEMQLLLTFHTLTGTTVEIAHTIFLTGFQSQTLIEVFKALGQMILLKSEQENLNSLCKRYSKAVAKRNKIVHGTWFLEAISDGSNIGQWVRVFAPINPILQKQIFDKFNQKARRNYRFTIPQLIQTCKDMKTLIKDMGQFNGIIINRIDPLPPDKVP